MRATCRIKKTCTNGYNLEINTLGKKGLQERVKAWLMRSVKMESVTVTV